MNRLLNFLAAYRTQVLYVSLLAVSWLVLSAYNEPNAQLRNQVQVGVSGYFHNVRTNITHYFGLARHNRHLQAQNSRLYRELDSLRGELFRYQYRFPLKQPLRELGGVVQSQADSGALFQVQTAQVLQNTTHQLFNYLMLDRGEKHGVKPKMGVLAANGVAGIVVAVSENYSLAQSLLNRNTRVSARLRNSNIIGALNWKGGSPSRAHLIHIPSHVEVNPGQLVETSGLSAIFPEGLPLGRVVAVEEQEESHFNEVVVELSTAFEQLRYVYLVQHPLQGEADSLQQQALQPR